LATEVKKRIVIASVLKPVTDTRMTEKIAASLAASSQHDVHVFGFPLKSSSHRFDSVTLHPSKTFGRISFNRMLQPWRICIKVITLKPSVFVVCTHELLIQSLLVKLITGCRVVYDVQENYFRNISFTNSFPPFLRKIVAVFVRAKEIITAPFVDHFFLAERSYSTEATFFRNKFTVIENKALPASVSPMERTKGQLLFSGTLSESTGVFIAIDLAVQLHRVDPTIRLVIIGYCALEAERQRLLALLNQFPFITLIGGNTLVSHDEIVHAIRSSYAGIISYPDNPSTNRSIPTKLFEYVGNKLPILLIHNPYWVDLCDPLAAAIAFNPAKINAQSILRELQTRSFYTADVYNVFWESEEIKLKKAISAILS
jgi:hypothetical protein